MAKSEAQALRYARKSTSETAPLSKVVYVSGLVFLLIAVVASGALVLESLAGIKAWGCGGVDSPCAKAANSVWGRVPGLGWPVSFVGFAYFLAMLVAFAASRRGVSRWLRWLARAGAAVSAVYVVVILALQTYCQYCIAAHFANFLFLAVIETRQVKLRAATTARDAALAGILFVLFSGALAVTGGLVERQTQQAAEAELDSSIAQVIAKGENGDQGDVGVDVSDSSADTSGEANEGADMAAGEENVNESTAATDTESSEVVEADSDVDVATDDQRDTETDDAPEEISTTAADEGQSTDQAVSARASDSSSSAPEVDHAFGPSGFTSRWRVGPEKAQVRIVTYSDYQCPDCKGVEEQIEELLEKPPMGVSLSVAAKHFPMGADCNPKLTRDMHPNACRAARAAEAAGMLGGNDVFWKMHFWLFDRGGRFNDAQLMQQVQTLGVDTGEFVRLMNSDEVLSRVQDDISEGIRLGLMYTPMVFVNGVQMRGIRVPGALTRTVKAVARSAPEAKTPLADRPPLAVEKYVDDWRKQPQRNFAAPEVAWPRGAEDAKVEVVVFGDYLLDGMDVLYPMLEKLLRERDDVRVTLRHYPFDRTSNPHIPAKLNGNPHSGTAAKVALAAGVLGGEESFWSVAEWLMAQERFTAAQIPQAARVAGIDPNDLRQAMSQQLVHNALRTDVNAGRRAGVQRIPTVLINQKQVPRWNLEGTDVLGRIAEIAAE